MHENKLSKSPKYAPIKLMLGAKALDEIEDQVSLESKEEGGIKNWKLVSNYASFQIMWLPKSHVLEALDMCRTYLPLLSQNLQDYVTIPFLKALAEPIHSFSPKICKFGTFPFFSTLVPQDLAFFP